MLHLFRPVTYCYHPVLDALNHFSLLSSLSLSFLHTIFSSLILKGLEAILLRVLRRSCAGFGNYLLVRSFFFTSLC